MLVLKLRDAMEAYRRRTGQRMTYAMLAEQTGIAASTLRTIGSNLHYHTTFGNVEKICLALDVSAGDLLEIIPDPPKTRPKRKKK
jgi:DNA-binding Xre family transcriptional regulator